MSRSHKVNISLGNYIQLSITIIILQFEKGGA